MRLSDAIVGYWLDKRQQFSHRTVESYTRIFGYLVDYLNDMQFEQITADDIRRFLAHLADTRNLSRRSQHDAWVPLSSLWTWAEGELKIPPGTGPAARSGWQGGFRYQPFRHGPGHKRYNQMSRKIWPESSGVRLKIIGSLLEAFI